MADEDWSLVIKAKRKLLDLPVRDLIRYRDMIFLFIKRDFVTQFKQTVLGPLWFVLNPIFSSVVYTFIFGNLARIGTDGIPHLLFYYSGSMMWAFFNGCFTSISDVFYSNAALFGKVYFPRLAIPISYVFSNAIRAAVQFAMLLVFYAYYRTKDIPLNGSWHIMFFPFLFCWIAAIALGTGLIVSSLTTKYRDLKNLVTFALNLLMYATPVVYPLSQIPGGFSWISYANPLCAPVELLRIWFFGAGTLPPAVILSSLAATALFLFLGLILFNQNERNFIDVI